MSGLKGAKTMSVGNGSADCFFIKDLHTPNINLGGDIKLTNGETIIGILKKIKLEINDLKNELTELKSKVDSIETE